MKRLRDGGMTLIEVVFALSILLIGVIFVVRSDTAMYHYRDQAQLRQQMLFYAAGQLERVLNNQSVIQGNESGNSQFGNFRVEFSNLGAVNSHLEKVKIAVSVVNTAAAPDPVALFSYRVK